MAGILDFFKAPGAALKKAAGVGDDSANATPAAKTPAATSVETPADQLARNTAAVAAKKKADAAARARIGAASEKARSNAVAITNAMSR